MHSHYPTVIYSSSYYFLNKNEFFVHKYLDSCEKYSNFAIEIDDLYCFFALLVTIMLIRTKKYITNVISLVY